MNEVFKWPKNYGKRFASKLLRILIPEYAERTL